LLWQPGDQEQHASFDTNPLDFVEQIQLLLSLKIVADGHSPAAPEAILHAKKQNSRGILPLGQRSSKNTAKSVC
jgi:hypothetical protein